eukprot:CAMPEP_0174817862 /NCGR_PEP_ID=MMETSP1107-20130205/423_1 /TAXON_ID=36770 /ORGANISM="Paraphysomonas vestita, Strain GFlagA" /LENGTH=176 /DNA_ID=CAMNT_0016028949 /DNA_START=84 /DNA_END=614 /DNA_ORIENTATION=-
MISNDGNCNNCHHAVNRHARKPSVAPSAPILAVEQQSNQKQQQQQNIVYASAIHLDTQTIHSSSSSNNNNDSDIPVYDPNRGGYVNGTGQLGDIHGNYNKYGNSGVGVNNIPESVQSTVAYGGALGEPYGNDPYSVTRTHRSEVHPDPSSPPSYTSISISDYSASYGGDPYSVKRV